MAAHGGAVLYNTFPALDADHSGYGWSSTILDSVAPVVANVYNYSANLETILAAKFGASTPVATSLFTSNHSTLQSVGRANGHVAPTAIDTGGYDWFERIFLYPTFASIRVLNLTNLDIKTLSTFRNRSDDLASITLDTGGGTYMSAEPAYPHQHNPLTYLAVVFTATKAGPGTYTGTITFDYATGPEVFSITILRVSNAPWRPLDKFVETLEWKTSIISARNLETRAAMREYPRLSYDYEFLLLERELNEFREVASNAETPLLTPLWYDEYLIGEVIAGAITLTVNTTTSEFVAGGYAYISEENGGREFVKVSAVGSGEITFEEAVVHNYGNATATPAVLTVILKASYREFNNNVYKGKVSLTGFDAVERVVPSQLEHDGVGVLSDPSIIKSALNAAFSTRGKYLDNGVGIVRFKPIENRVRNTLDHLWKTSGYANRKAMKDWIYSRVGRQKQFLVPTFQNDLFLATPYLGGTEMEVLEMHFEPPFYFQVKLQTGVIYYGTCATKATAAGVDTLTIDALGSAFDDTELDLFSIIFENRYGSDKFKITHTNHQLAELKTTTTGV